MTQDSTTPARVVAAARQWIGTPYHHQGSVRGIGADCLGLVRGVWREIYGREAESPPPYSRDWAETGGEEAMLAAAARHLMAIDHREAGAGDVVVFRMRAGSVAKHAAILSSPTMMIHAMEGGPACEVALSNWWRRRIAGAFRFPARPRQPLSSCQPRMPQNQTCSVIPGEASIARETRDPA